MKIILITGVSRGIGKALAQRFLHNGDVVLGTSTHGTVDYKHKNLYLFQLDLSDSKSRACCIKNIKDLKQKIDILINNAGIVVEEEAKSPRIAIDYLRNTLEVNVIGTIDFTEGIIPLIKKGGHIVNISSRAGSFGDQHYNFNYPSYRISKTALNMVTKILATRLAGKIIVSSVHPGWVKTDMGGKEAEISATAAAEDLFKLANSTSETGQFWFKGKKFPW